MPTLKRWIPLISVAVLVGQVLLRTLGYAGPADAIGAVSGAIGLGPDQETATLVTAALGAGTGLALKVRAMVAEARR